ncbi:prepilin-type N-terminal cleavage/methylation domain-containing protein [Ruficoccus sp. ZRK36]|uniref:type II secretion system protein n=1 Tax=Ruficoccus sp. ZRK36 TaxID=2866311 RepID=UPI001C738EF0|nr:prepilin-type N-terminal cleavage/methylation domain-containing protein [Ruficoccus sp. ZRK36]QYY37205.1 prepilin-type N-terminal cleavage/methylation domain-containing protein [Ruficoccus sp. ZRK36]
MLRPYPPIQSRTRSHTGAAFSLVEVMVGLVILALLGALTASAVNSAQESARLSKSTATIRQLGTAALVYATDNKGRWPRSNHSFTRSERQWWLALSGYLWKEPLSSRGDPRYIQYEARMLRDPLNPAEGSGGSLSNRYSYGINGYLQLDPAIDDYEGRPAHWGSAQFVPHPERTVLFAANRQQTSDHFMAHFWSKRGDDLTDLDPRNDDKVAYVYCDGHVAWQLPAKAFAPEAGVDHWNPSRAGIMRP